MNIGDFEAFLTVCEMGSITGAAQKLYISQQALSQRLLRMEQELGVRLLHRGKPTALTEAGLCMQQAARAIGEDYQRLLQELARCRDGERRELTIGLLDYGTPDFLPQLLNIFFQRRPNVVVSLRELPPGASLPAEIPLFVSARALGSNFKSEALFYDRLTVCVTDELLQRIYGQQWQARRERLRRGELAALEGCPVLHHQNTPLEKLEELAFRKNRLMPDYLPVLGSIGALLGLCAQGRGALVNLCGYSGLNGLPCYPVGGFEEAFATVFICYRAEDPLSEAAGCFVDTMRRYFQDARR